MLTMVLIAAWITPALIAGMLGWRGIWGTGSALIEYLIPVPVPVAGGVLHVPSYACALAVIFANSRQIVEWREFEQVELVVAESERAGIAAPP